MRIAFQLTVELEWSSSQEEDVQRIRQALDYVSADLHEIDLDRAVAEGMAAAEPESPAYPVPDPTALGVASWKLVQL